MCLAFTEKTFSNNTFSYETHSFYEHTAVMTPVYFQTAPVVSDGEKEKKLLSEGWKYTQL